MITYEVVIVVPLKPRLLSPEIPFVINIQHFLILLLLLDTGINMEMLISAPWVFQQGLVAGADVENNRQDTLRVEAPSCHIQVQLPWVPYCYIAFSDP